MILVYSLSTTGFGKQSSPTRIQTEKPILFAANERTFVKTREDRHKGIGAKVGGSRQAQRAPPLL